jgi:hypothetical protein
LFIYSFKIAFPGQRKSILSIYALCFQGVDASGSEWRYRFIYSVLRSTVTLRAYSVTVVSGSVVLMKLTDPKLPFQAQIFPVQFSGKPLPLAGKNDSHLGEWQGMFRVTRNIFRYRKTLALPGAKPPPKSAV